MSAWKFIHRAPDPRLRDYVKGYCLYDEHTGTPLVRRELPTDRVTLIVNTGPPIRVGDHGATTWSDQPVGFVAGLWDTYALTETPGSQRGLQIDLTAVGAHLLLRATMRDLRNRVVALDQLLGCDRAELLREAVAEASAFAAADRFLLDRLDDACSPVPTVTRALARLHETDGALRVNELAAEIGCSRRHLAARFDEQVGISPKLLARILRFQRAKALADVYDDWAEIAQRSGYYDQAHLNRDFNQFAGCPPTELVKRRLPDAGGVVG